MIGEFRAHPNGNKAAASLKEVHFQLDLMMGTLPAAGCMLEEQAEQAAGAPASFTEQVISGEGDATEPTPLELASLVYCLDGASYPEEIETVPAARAALFLLRLHERSITTLRALHEQADTPYNADDILWQARRSA